MPVTAFKLPFPAFLLCAPIVPVAVGFVWSVSYDLRPDMFPAFLPVDCIVEFCFMTEFLPCFTGEA